MANNKAILLSVLDANTTLMLLLPHLTPKESLPLLMSCKSFHDSNVGKNPKNFVDPQIYASRVISDYKAIIVSSEYVIAQVGRLLIDNYPPSMLLSVTINTGNHQEFITMRQQFQNNNNDDDDGGGGGVGGVMGENVIEILCDCECRINFFKSKGKPNQISPVYNYTCYPTATE